MITANIAEIFSGIQGEGMLVGERQMFVRFSGCNLRCRYCDTKWAWEDHADCRVEKTPGTASFVFVRNPIDPARLSAIVSDLRDGENLHHSICFTGGEPLLHAEFLSEHLPTARSLFSMTYLETNGTLPGELSRVVDSLDVVSMDIKIESTSGVGPDLETHRRFLLTAVRTNVFVKVVVSGQTRMEEIVEAASVIGSVDTEIPLVLQPAAGERPEDQIAARELLRFQGMAKQELRTVRVIPQTHKIMGLL